MGISYPKADVSGVGIKTYTVEKGDTLSKIARENNIDYNELVDYNHIEDPNYIEVGQKIDIPTEEVDTSEYLDKQVEKEEEGISKEEEEIYVVQSGDTLSKIARDNNISVEEIAEYNHIENPDYIELGQKIVIPNKESKNTTEEISDVDSNIEDQTVDTIPETEPSIENVNLNEHSDVLLTEEEIEPEGEVSQIEEVLLETEPETENVLLEPETEPETESVLLEPETESETESVLLEPETEPEKSSIETESEETMLETEPVTEKVTEADVVEETIDFENMFQESNGMYDIDIDSIKLDTRVGQAYEQYKEELKDPNLIAAKVSENIFMTVKIDIIDGNECITSHVVINDPSQINGEPANGSYASGLERSSSAAQRLNSVLLINGSHFLSDGSEHLIGPNNIAIVNSEIKAANYLSGGNELLLDKDGKIFSATGKSAQELLDAGVKYSFACHSTPVIVNGDISPSYAETNLYKRTIIGMTKPCEYYVVTDTNYQNRLSDTASYLLEKGCINAYSLDQGGSVSLAYKDDLLNTPSDDSGERYVGDFLYFTD